MKFFHVFPVADGAAGFCWVSRRLNPQMNPAASKLAPKDCLFGSVSGGRNSHESCDKHMLESSK
jgi:hypothetical protein